MDKIKIEQLPDWFEAVGTVMTDCADRLCEMDALMGDGDLGLTMKKGFAALPDILRSLDEGNLGKKLFKAGMKMASVVPSTMGTLMASGIMEGGKALMGAEEIGSLEYQIYLESFARGIAKRGNCTRGERTVLDAVGAAADKLKDALAENPEMKLEEAGEIAFIGAGEGVELTKSMVPKYGKAAVHKLAAEGMEDQGACAGMYMIKGYLDYINGGGQ